MSGVSAGLDSARDGLNQSTGPTTAPTSVSSDEDFALSLLNDSERTASKHAASSPAKALNVDESERTNKRCRHGDDDDVYDLDRANGRGSPVPKSGSTQPALLWPAGACRDPTRR